MQNNSQTLNVVYLYVLNTGEDKSDTHDIMIILKAGIAITCVKPPCHMCPPLAESLLHEVLKVFMYFLTSGGKILNTLFPNRSW